MKIPWQRFVPVWGWYWNLSQPHEAMYCNYDSTDLGAASTFTRVSIGFGGPYSQLVYMLLVGLIIPAPRRMLGSYERYVIMMMTWQLLYFYWYAQHFHDDCHSDFVHFVSRGSDLCPPQRDPVPVTPAAFATQTEL